MSEWNDNLSPGTGDAPGDAALHAALERQLARAFPPPALPAGFRARLQAAIARSTDEELAQRRAQAELDHRRQTGELERAWLRLRWSTLGTLLGTAFVAGVGVTLAMPWLREQLGATGAAVAPLAAAALFVVGVVLASWRGRPLWSAGAMALLRRIRL